MRSNTQESEYPMNEIKFTLNEPQVLSLSDPTGDLDGANVLYPTLDGRTLCLPRHAAIKLNSLFVETGEEFSAARYRKEGQPAEWVFALTAKSEQERAAKEVEKAGAVAREQAALARKSVEVQLEKSLSQVREIPRKGTGTYGPAPAPALTPRIAAKGDRQSPPPRVPYEIAILHITRTVVGVLRETGEQWGDQAKQDLVSTLAISAAKAGAIGFDFQGGGEGGR